LGLDCEGERRKNDSKPFGKKGKGINWFFEKEFNIGYHVVVAK